MSDSLIRHSKNRVHFFAVTADRFERVPAFSFKPHSNQSTEHCMYTENVSYNDKDDHCKICVMEAPDDDEHKNVILVGTAAPFFGDRAFADGVFPVNDTIPHP